MIYYKETSYDRNFIYLTPRYEYKNYSRLCIRSEIFEKTKNFLDDLNLQNFINFLYKEYPPYDVEERFMLIFEDFIEFVAKNNLMEYTLSEAYTLWRLENGSGNQY
jgi:hypothetical protein